MQPLRVKSPTGRPARFSQGREWLEHPVRLASGLPSAPIGCPRPEGRSELGDLPHPASNRVNSKCRAWKHGRPRNRQAARRVSRGKYVVELVNKLKTEAWVLQ